MSRSHRNSAPDYGWLAAELAAVVGPDHVTGAEAERNLHSRDESDHPPALPDLVVYPAATTEVSEIVALASQHRIPVVGWGSGTSVGGHPIPVHGGIVVDFRRMDRILALYPEDFQVVTQPGMLRLDLEDRLGRRGLFFPPDPGANASVGGMLANNAAGVRALRYGSAAANVLGLEVVLADGTVIKTGSRSVKQSAGYDLTHLFVGSEGTLGLITAAVLKLAPIPEHFATAVVAFPEVAAAARAVHAIIGGGLQPAALELVHQDHIRWMNEDDDAGLIEAPTLMIEYSGPSESQANEAMAMTVDICHHHGAEPVERGLDREARTRLWRRRHGTRDRLHRRFPGRRWISLDVSVPISRFADLIEYAELACGEEGLVAGMVGHAGDGNLHLGLPYRPENEEEAETARSVGHAIVLRALEWGGTCTGEHGVGIGKRKYLVTEHGREAVATMWTLKRALDPHGILNPGKVLPELP